MSRSSAPLADATSGDRKPGGGRRETVPKFIPTPERLSQYLEMNIKEVASALQSVEGRQMIYQKLMEHQQDLLKIDPLFNPDLLREQLELAGEVLHQKERYLQDVQSPEKKGLFKRAWEKMKGFGKRHPFVTVLLLLALIAGATSLGLYLSGNLEFVASKVGLGKIFGAADAAGDMMVPVPPTPIVPGAGELAVPPPANLPPGAVGPT